MNVAGNAMAAIAAQKYSDGDRGLLSEVSQFNFGMLGYRRRR
jgi:hypothetical protein